MKYILFALAILVLAFPSLGQTLATGDFLFTQKSAPGTLNVIVPVAPVASRMLGFDGSGDLGTVDLSVVYQPVNSNLTLLSGMGFTLDSFALTYLDEATAGGVLGALGFTAFTKTIVDDADAPGLRATIGAASLVANTFTGAQTIQVDSTVNGVKIGRGLGDDADTTMLGAGALAATTSTSNHNVAIGKNALAALTSASDSNTVVGSNSFKTITTSASYNVGLGYDVGSFYTDGTTPVTGGSGNVLIGNRIRTNSVTPSNCIVLGGSQVSVWSNQMILGNPALTEAVIYGAMNEGDFFLMRTTVDQTTTATTNGDSNISFPAAIGEIWLLEADLVVTSPAAGTKFQITAPSGSTTETEIIATTLPNTTSSVVGTRITAVNTLSGNAITVGTTALVRVSCVVNVVSNAGTVAIGFASVTAAQSSVIKANSRARIQLMERP